MVHVGIAITKTLEQHGVERVFQVPGESFLPVLDGLHDSNIKAVVARQEGGATYMAEAHGKATGNPGVAMVTRGPGASNAFVGIHSAWQDGTPMVVFVGLIPTSHRDRESFQEFDPKAWFGSQAKQVFVLDDAASASRVVAEAFFQARQGRPGPVIVGLPEDILHSEFTGSYHPPIPVAEGAISDEEANSLSNLLSEAQRPLFFVGGGRWTSEAAKKFNSFACKYQIPVVQDFRAADRIPYSSPANAGWLGYGRDDAAAELIEKADVLVQIGAVLTDVPSDGFTLRQETQGTNILINVDSSLRGHSGVVHQHILASPVALAEKLEQITPSTDKVTEWFKAAHEAQQDYGSLPKEWRPTAESTAHMEAAMSALQEQLPFDSIQCFGAGNHCIWAQRFLAPEVYPAQLSTRNGSMGYSVPSSIAAKLQFPERTVVAIAGDGEILMNGQELATALQFNAPFLCIVMNNGEFGTIRDHQENHFPDRVSGTQLTNPNFASIAEGFGAYGERVNDDSQVSSAIERALRVIHDEGRPAVIDLITDPALSSPEAE